MITLPMPAFVVICVLLFLCLITVIILSVFLKKLKQKNEELEYENRAAAMCQSDD